MNKLLSKLQKDIYDNSVDYANFRKEAHKLAENQYLPAKDFFLEGLNHDNWLWREDCILNLGFHYRQLEEKYIKKIEKILMTDSVSNVRSAAIGALEYQLSKPDQSLLFALNMDLDEDNRIQAFGAILNLCGVPDKKINKMIKKIKKERLILSTSTAIKILEENLIPIPEVFSKNG